MGHPQEPLSAAIYTRLSKGFGRSIAEQEAEDRAECEANGWPVAGVYSDRVSASRFATKARDDWARLLADLEAGRFGVLVLWESSRGDRDAATWLALLARCRDKSVLIHITKDHQTFDMSRRRDWRTLAVDGVDSQSESEQIAERIRRNVAANAGAGRPHGKVPYGYERLYDAHTKQLTEQRPHAKTARVVREIITRVAASEPVTCITRDLNARGIASPAGGKWSRAMVRLVATNPAYAGRRRWKGTEMPGVWKPLVKEALFARAARVLSDQAARGTRPGRAKWMLSGVARCDKCGTPLVAFPRRDRATLYGCPDGHAFIRQDWLDLYITVAVVALLDSPVIWEEVARSGDADVLAARAEADRLQVQLDELARDLTISPRTLAIREAELLPAIKAAEKRAQEVAVPPALRDLLTGGAGRIRELLEAMPVQAKKDCIRELLEIRLRPAGRHGGGGNHAFDESRVIVERTPDR